MLLFKEWRNPDISLAKMHMIIMLTTNAYSTEERIKVVFIIKDLYLLTKIHLHIRSDEKCLISLEVDILHVYIIQDI